MGPTRKPNVCPRLSRRALGFFSRDAGVVQRTNLGILRALVCQVTAGPGERGGGLRATWWPSRPGRRFYAVEPPFLRRLCVMGRSIMP